MSSGNGAAAGNGSSGNGSGNGHGTLRLKLRIWRQEGPDEPGGFLDVDAPDIPVDCSFLEMLDIVNERLIDDDVEPVVFAHDCREGICGTCGVMINGRPHGPEKSTATCQLHMRKFSDGDEIVIEPFRAASFPVVKDLMVDRRAFDRIVESGGYISAPTAPPPTPTRSRFPRMSPSSPWTRRPASAAGRAWRPAPTRRPSCSPRPSSVI